MFKQYPQYSNGSIVREKEGVSGLLWIRNFVQVLSYILNFKKILNQIP